jgi:glucose dehydrogenase
LSFLTPSPCSKVGEKRRRGEKGKQEKAFIPFASWFAHATAAVMKMLFRVVALAIGVCSGSMAWGQSVDTPRLLNAGRDDKNWLIPGRDYGNQRFVALDQINAQNVKALALRWKFQTGIKNAFQTTPLVADGVMYVTTPKNNVVALDAKTGKQLWRYEYTYKTDKLCCGVANRGAGLGYGKVFMATADAGLVALDQKTGKLVWDVTLAAPNSGKAETTKALSASDPLRQAEVTGASGAGANMAPLVYKGKVIVGITGAGYGLHLKGEKRNQQLGAVVGMAGDYGLRGFLAAFDVETGKEVWRWHTVPDKGWEGEWRAVTLDGAPLHRDIAAEKTAFAEHGDAWKTGGGSTWTTPALDPNLGLLFLGVGNPSPQMDGLTRPGDNLYTVSLVALDVETGKLRWHYQQVPHDLWGYDVASPPVLFDTEVDGKKLSVIGQASKTGWFYVNDRKTGTFLYKSEAFVPQENIFTPPTKEGVRIAPGAGGGASWSPVSYDATTGMVYVAALHMPTLYTVKETPGEDGQPAQHYTTATMTEEPRWGTLSAINTRTGKILWQRKTEKPLIGGVVATKGGLVFVGEGNGRLNAFDAKTGDLLWQFITEAGINAPPISYEVDGTQYVAIAAGGTPMFGNKPGDELLVFALPK